MNTKKETFSIEAKFPIAASEQFIREQFMNACEDYIAKTALARYQRERQALLEFIKRQNEKDKNEE